MTREAALSGFRAMIDAGLAFVNAEFRIEHAVSEADEQHVVDFVRTHEQTIERLVVAPAFVTYKRSALTQFEHVIDCIEADEPLSDHRRTLIAADPLLPAIDSESEDRLNAVGSIWSRIQWIQIAFEPIVTSESNDFWPALTTVFDRRSAEDRLLPALAFAAPAREHPGAFQFTIELGAVDDQYVPASLHSGSLEYTDEAIRALTRGERRLDSLIRRQLDERFTDTSAAN